jgi:hypothetical protein
VWNCPFSSVEGGYDRRDGGVCVICKCIKMIVELFLDWGVQKNW